MEHEEKQLTRRECIALAIGGVASIGVPGCIGRLQTKADKGGKSFSFGVLTDIHYWNHEPSGTRYHRASVRKIKECAKDFKSRNTVFAIQLGDFIDGGVASLDELACIYQQTFEMPKYHVIGNHDFSAGRRRKGRDKLVDKLGMKNRYYDFIYNRWRFIVLDSNDISLYAYPAGSEKYKQAELMFQELEKTKAYNSAIYNGALGSEQIVWLKNTLDKACKAGEKVILFCHMPVFPKCRPNLWNDQEVVKILESYNCVTAYIAGHMHEGNYGVKNGIHYLTMNALVETSDTNSHAVIEVHDDYLKVIGYGREPSRLLVCRDYS